MSDFYLIQPEDVEARATIDPGDIVILHTGYHRYYAGGAEPDLTRYFFKIPGGGIEPLRSGSFPSRSDGSASTVPDRTTR